jgi:hypothetical protein
MPKTDPLFGLKVMFLTPKKGGLRSLQSPGIHRKQPQRFYRAGPQLFYRLPEDRLRGGQTAPTIESKFEMDGLIVHNHLGNDPR